MNRYRNIFWSARSLDPQVYETDAKPTKYRGHVIYQRIKGHCWDVVRDGDCIGQYAGERGARDFVDTLLDGVDEVAQFKRDRVAELQRL